MTFGSKLLGYLFRTVYTGWGNLIGQYLADKNYHAV